MLLFRFRDGGPYFEDFMWHIIHQRPWILFKHVAATPGIFIYHVVHFKQSQAPMPTIVHRNPWLPSSKRLDSRHSECLVRMLTSSEDFDFSA